MKKTLFFIAAALLLCSQLKAQDLALATTSNSPLQLSLTENLQTDVNSIYSLPMPNTDFALNDQLNAQQYASRKGWGIACIVVGGSTMLGGITMWLGGDMFNNVNQQMGDMSGFEDDPDFQQGQQAMQTVGNGVKTIGIVTTVAGAALVGTGIWLVSSDGGSSHGRRGHGRRGGHRRSHRRHADLFQQPTMEPDWGLCLNATPTSAGLTFVF
jgi:hypothetical protein